MQALALRFRLKDGPHKGRLTRAYGGIWNSALHVGAGDYVGFYDASGRWTGDHPEPGPGQLRIVDISEQQWPYIHDFQSRVSLAVGGRRSGKSFALAPKAVICALHFPRLRGVLLGPTYRQVQNVWNHIRRIVPRHWLAPGSLGINRTEHLLRFANGSEIVLLHAHKDDASRSEGCAWGGYDERQDISEAAAANALLSTSEGGDRFVIFETATIKEELREHYDKMVEDPQCSIYRMTSRGNPFIDHSLFDFAEGFLDRAAVARELEAQWPELEGRCFSPFITEDGGHIREAPLRDEDGNPVEDITAAYCAEHFDTPSWGERAASVIIGVDPPHHAAIYRMHRDGILHQIDEIIAGTDGRHEDVRGLARQCWARYPGGVVIRDPHDTRSGGQGGRGGSHDCDRYFRQAGYRMVHCPRAGVEYQLTAVRARMERDKLYVAPRCVHTIECYERQVYDKNGKPDKTVKSRISPRWTIDHAGDATRYPIYKLFPARVDYEVKETETG